MSKVDADERSSAKTAKEDRHAWRQNDSQHPPRPRQEGIPPRAFHSSGRNRRPRGLDKVLNESATNVVRAQRKHVSLQHKLRRAAFKEVTSLKTWPLQELAMQDLDHWCMVHAGKSAAKFAIDVNGDTTSDVETHGDSTGLSSSSLDEPKRSRRKDSDDEEDLSPRKSSLRHQFKQDFIRERDLQVLDDGTALPALWCMEPRIFAVEKSVTGKRKYIVGHLGRFMDYYWRKCDVKQRHYYELIREKTPCRLYFDLEFSKVSNPEITEDRSDSLLKELMEELILEFKNIYNIELGKDCIVELDSSTETKFSCHWIVHLPNGELFSDATAAGRFVRVFVGRLADELASGQLKRSTLANYLFVNAATPKNKHQTRTPMDEITSKSCVVDLGVYTRNRLFRILGSSKFGKPASAALHISASNEFPLPIGNASFYASSLQVKEPEQSKDEPENDIKQDLQNFESSVDWTAHAEALAATLVVPMNVMKCKFPILVDSDAAKAFGDTDAGNLSSASVVGNATARSATAEIRTGRSPFPILDKFVQNKLATREGVLGAIRGWSIENNGKIPKSITYQMVRNRWCESIGRAHKSNNIMWTVDFATMNATQGCHDPECRALKFRGKPISLPDDIRLELSDALFDYELMAQADEAELTQRKLGPSQVTVQSDGVGLATKTIPAISQSEFDDEDFERALLALTIDEEKARSKTGFRLTKEMD